MKDYNIQFNYSFQSVLGPMEGYRYVREVLVEIINADDSGTPLEKAGHAELKLIYLNEAENNEFNL